MTAKAPLLGLLLAASLGAADWFPVQIEAPAYPPLANQARLEGSVRLKLLLDESGAVQKVEVLAGHPLLARTAQDNIRLWKFAAPCLEGHHAPGVIEFTYDFRIEGEVETKPTTRFRYQHPYKAIVISEALHWTPDSERRNR
jgi:TonB family protein